MIDSQLGPFKIIKKIASGGMGDVYQAHDPIHNRIVAIKTLRQEFNDSSEFISRFKREANILSKIVHHNTVIVYSTEIEKDIFYIVMEYVNGTTLRDFLLTHRFFITDIISMMMQILDGIDAIHRQGILHRDIKLANVMISENNLVKIGDFGVAKSIYEEQSTITKTGQLLGTLHMLPPEILAGEKFTVQSDIYSLGLLFFEILSGFNPIYGKNDAETLQNIKDKKIDFPAELSAIIHWELRQEILKMLDKDSSKRPSNVSEVKKKMILALEKQKKFLPTKGERYPSSYPQPDNLIDELVKSNCVYMLNQAYALELASDFGTKTFESIRKEDLIAALIKIRKIGPQITHVDDAPEIENIPNNDSELNKHQAIQKLKRIKTDEISIDAPVEEKKAAKIYVMDMKDVPAIEMEKAPRKKLPPITDSSEDKRKNSGGFFGKMLSIFKKNKK